MTLEQTLRLMFSGQTLIESGSWLITAMFDEEDPAPGPWFIGVVKCRICDREHVGGWTEEILDDTRQECIHCGHPTCEPVVETIHVLEIAYDDTGKDETSDIT